MRFIIDIEIIVSFLILVIEEYIYIYINNIILVYYIDKEHINSKDSSSN